MINILEILNQKVEFEVPPPELCLKCGKCCRTIVSEIPNEQLAAMAQNNEEEAKVFFNIFKHIFTLQYYIFYISIILYTYIFIKL